MHELSIALRLIELAEEEAQRHGGSRVQAVHLRLGPLSGVVREALSSAYEVARTGTALAEACLQIEETPIIAWCPTCCAEKQIESLQCLQCPRCGAWTGDIRGGRELEITGLELEA